MALKPIAGFNFSPVWCFYSEQWGAELKCWWWEQESHSGRLLAVWVGWGGVGGVLNELHPLQVRVLNCTPHHSFGLSSFITSLRARTFSPSGGSGHALWSERENVSLVQTMFSQRTISLRAHAQCQWDRCIWSCDLSEGNADEQWAVCRSLSHTTREIKLTHSWTFNEQITTNNQLQED